MDETSVVPVVRLVVIIRSAHANAEPSLRLIRYI